MELKIVFMCQHPVSCYRTVPILQLKQYRLSIYLTCFIFLQFPFIYFFFFCTKDSSTAIRIMCLLPPLPLWPAVICGELDKLLGHPIPL